ncbi:MAG TPA: hypothetical protein VMJ75_11490 [Candidatus Acidoferrales bacterium]|nr:hypothetical protein [Candidatus Acidoferrales bacterium]
MFGWMILFALMTIVGSVMALLGAPAFSSIVALTFGLLFLIGLFARLIGGRAW